LNYGSCDAIVAGMQTQSIPVGGHIRQWRERRRRSQLDLAYSAEISPRHLSFVETGRSRPSREMILLLAEELEIPVRERNVLLVAGGYAPIFQERPLTDPALAAARTAIDLVLAAYRPYPAFALDRHWNVSASNQALPQLYEGVDPSLLAGPINVVRLSLHPQGLTPRIENLAEWRAHILHRLRKQIDLTADAGLVELEREVAAYPAPRESTAAADGIVVPLRIRVGDDVLSFFTTTMVFGTPLDITLSELAIESFFPADDRTIEAVRNLSN
jgi:transcriptional regulator with XRE-family HTH domain